MESGALPIQGPKNPGTWEDTPGTSSENGSWSARAPNASFYIGSRNGTVMESGALHFFQNLEITALSGPPPVGWRFLLYFAKGFKAQVRFLSYFAKGF